MQEILVALYQPETLGGNSQAWPLLRRTFFSEGRPGRVRFALTEKGCALSDASWIVSCGGTPIPNERVAAKADLWARILIEKTHAHAMFGET